ncbi:MAG TPA: pyridoxal-phosphate dependent enzyme [Candidatus Acidoferrales bacterium]|nr:pyridoxal-phosphate dependent enzyme [Candidatus Acidoferrales bacterium]
MSSAPQVETKNFEPPSWEDIREAHARIASRIHRTPILTSHSLDAMAGAQLFFKCDNFQKTGSFKIRGAANAILALTDEEAAHGIVTPSSGNHGAAVACAAAWRGVPAYIVMPKNAPAVKCRAVEGYGGRITFSEPTITSRQETAARIQAETGAILIHPYDNDRIITGQATAAKELLEEIPDIDAVFTPVSGGGLLSGTCLSAKAIRSNIRIIGCEPARADDAYRSLATGILQSLDSSDTIADGLRASLAPRTFAILRRHLDRVLLVGEEEIIAAMRLVWERMKIIIEPSSAVAIAPLLKPGAVARLDLPPRADGASPKLGVIFSGGNVDFSALPF